MRLFKRITRFYWKVLASPQSHALHLGITIGKNCVISTHNWPSEGYLVTIGDNVAITDGVTIHTHGGGRTVRENHPDFDCFGKVVIEDWAYIGAYSQIMPGVTIGKGALVAGGSIVTKSVAPHTVVGGNPAHYICTTEDYYERNKQFNVSTKGLNHDEKKKFLLSLTDDKFIKK